MNPWTREILHYFCTYFVSLKQIHVHMAGINVSALKCPCFAYVLYSELLNIQLKPLHVYFTYVLCDFFHNLCFISRCSKRLLLLLF